MDPKQGRGLCLAAMSSSDDRQNVARTVADPVGICVKRKNRVRRWDGTDYYRKYNGCTNMFAYFDDCSYIIIFFQLRTIDVFSQKYECLLPIYTILPLQYTDNRNCDIGSRVKGKDKNMNTRRKTKKVSGYFTVEASFVIPIVFLCYMAVVLFLCYAYERCIWEQNACRLPVWMKYVEGYAGLYPEEADVFSRENICHYVQRCLKNEEESRYLLGTNLSASVSWKGDKVNVNRNMVYMPLSEKVQKFQITVYCPKPTTYIRTAESIRGWIEKDKEVKEKLNDKE